MRKDTDDHEQLVGGVALQCHRQIVWCMTIFKLQNIPFHERQEGGIKAVWFFQLVRILPEEENAFVNELADDQTENFA
jgi:hypothetical protein